MRLTLRNDFHNSMVHLYPKGVHGNKLSRHQVARARRELCGVQGCTCGGDAGERGHQEWDFRPVYLEHQQDGSALIRKE